MERESGLAWWLYLRMLAEPEKEANKGEKI
jgi:hypothetical protein